MIDIEQLRKNPQPYRDSVKNRNYDPKIVDDFLAVDDGWRKATAEVEKMRAEQKKLGAERKIEEAKALKGKIAELETGLNDLELKRKAALKKIPNLTMPWVVIGKDDSENKTLREVGKRPVFSFKHKDYVELSEKLGIIDTVRAGKVSGSRFGYIMGGLAQLEFALIQFAVDTVTNEKLLAKLIKQNKLKVSPKAFIPVIPPVMIKEEMMEGMGYVERGGDEIYHFDADKLYLVGTSEQSIGPMHSGETFAAEELPRRYLGFSTCFRREAGSYGKDTKGILRVHQFNKLEMFSITTSDLAEDEHKLLLAIEEYLMQALELPYRVLNICSGDLGDPAAAKYDIEVWLPGQLEGKGQYRETHSTSNTTDFQSRRLGIKYKDATGSYYAHMLNGTAFSERPLLAIIENFQTEKGTVKVPKVLQKYTGLKEIK
jgi:seryl-tRNA synthetase